MNYLLASIITALSVRGVFYYWKNKPPWPYAKSINFLLIISSLPAWVFAAGSEFGTTYYCIALSLCGLLFVISNREKLSGQLALQKRKKQDTDLLKRRSGKTLLFIAALLLPIFASALLLFVLTKLSHQPSANYLINSIIVVLVIWPLLMIWLAGKQTQVKATLKANNLSAHRLIGVVCAALLYLVCISGSVSVFFEELERLEQPDVEEYATLQPSLVSGAMKEYQQRLERTPASIYIVLPTDGFPRTHITDGVDEWFLNEDGSFAEQPHVPWTEMIKGLHTHLHLSYSLGMMIVGITGVLLTALIISGIIAHPTIFRDAFLLRKKKSRRQQQTDLHNRFAVWALPFHLMIALTGAFIGLSNDFFSVMAKSGFEGNSEAVLEAIYGDDPELHSDGGPINYVAAFNNLKAQVPDATPIYLVVHKLGEPEQMLEIAARLPGRFTYSEMYRFNQQGELINSQGLADGPAGRQLAYSTYRIHFGHFDGLLVKLLYGVLGLSLTLVCVFGMNIWFARRGSVGVVYHLWQGWVWGIPAMMLICYPLSLLALPLETCFWVGLTTIVLLNFIKSLLRPAANEAQTAT